MAAKSMHSLILTLVLIYFLLNKPSNNMPTNRRRIHQHIHQTYFLFFKVSATAQNFFCWCLSDEHSTKIYCLLFSTHPVLFVSILGIYFSVFLCSIVLLIWWSNCWWLNWLTTHINWTGVDWFYAIHISLVTTLDLFI